MTGRERKGLCVLAGKLVASPRPSARERLSGTALTVGEPCLRAHPLPPPHTHVFAHEHYSHYELEEVKEEKKKKMT